MDKAKLKTFLLGLGWAEDRFGHLQKTVTRKRPHVDKGEVTHVRQYRIKLQDRSCRIEVQYEIGETQYNKAEKKWLRWGGDFYSKMVELPEGRIRIGSYIFGKKGDLNDN